MKTMLAAYAAAAVTMLGMDAVWLSVSADVLYRPLLGDIMLPGSGLSRRSCSMCSMSWAS